MEIPTTLLDQINNQSSRLQAINIQQPVEHIWWLVEKIRSAKKINLLIENRPLSLEEFFELKNMVDQMVNTNIPIQYLLGQVPFAGVDIMVRKPILIPRPETEEMVLYIVRAIQEAQITTGLVLDMCTGSGCIVIALAYRFPSLSFVATDINLEALILAKENSDRYGLTNIQYIHSDLFSALHDYAFDMIISNPPYVSYDEWERVNESVKNHEDPMALIANQNGIGILTSIVKQAPHYLKKDSPWIYNGVPQLILETGGKAQVAQLRTQMMVEGFEKVWSFSDMEKKERFVAGVL